MNEPTLKQWKRRALSAESEVKTLRDLRKFDAANEMNAHTELCKCRVALQEAREAIEWAIGGDA